MPSISRTLFHAAFLLVMMAGTVTLGSAQQSIQGGSAQPGDIICLAAVDVDVFQSLHIVGNAFDPNTNSPVVVKWIAFDQPTNTRILKVVDSQVNTFIAGGGDLRYSCINNDSGILVTFNLSQTVQ